MHPPSGIRSIMLSPLVCHICILSHFVSTSASNCSGLPCSYHCQLVGGAARCYCPEGYRLQGHTSCLAEGTKIICFTYSRKMLDPTYFWFALGSKQTVIEIRNIGSKLQKDIGNG